MNAINQINKPWFTISHFLTTLGLLGGLLAYANSTENKTVKNETKLQAIQETQKEIKQDAKEIQRGQRENRDILMQIKSKLESR